MSEVPLQGVSVWSLLVKGLRGVSSRLWGGNLLPPLLGTESAQLGKSQDILIQNDSTNTNFIRVEIPTQRRLNMLSM